MKWIVRGLLVSGLVLASARPGLAASCCTDDPTGSKVADARATAETNCHNMGEGCNDPGVNHGTYVSCIANQANVLSQDPNTLPKSCKGRLKRCAARSTCGKPGFVTCCITGTTKCKIKNESTDSLKCENAGGSDGSATSCCDACGPLTCP